MTRGELISTVEKLYRATLVVATEHGSRGITYRSVAHVAGVSVGIIKYHFTDLKELTFESFKYYIDSMVQRYEDSIRSADSVDEVVEILADVAGTRLIQKPSDATLMYELYAYAARDARYRELVIRWMMRTRSALECHASMEAAVVLEALLEGSILQGVVGYNPLSRKDLETAFRNLIE